MSGGNGTVVRYPKYATPTTDDVTTISSGRRGDDFTTDSAVLTGS
jgi:hypothetical protein